MAIVRVKVSSLTTSLLSRLVLLITISIFAGAGQVRAADGQVWNGSFFSQKLNERVGVWLTLHANPKPSDLRLQSSKAPCTLVLQPKSFFPTGTVFDITFKQGIDPGPYCITSFVQGELWIKKEGRKLQVGIRKGSKTQIQFIAIQSNQR